MSECVICHQQKDGGVSGNGDPYGVLRKVFGEERPWTFTCWDCYQNRGGFVADMQERADVTERLRASGLCAFIKAWIGPCLAQMPCEEHANLKCRSCGAIATHECNQASSLVCGHLLCDACEHCVEGPAEVISWNPSGCAVMTRITIWETPENHEQYRDVPCEMHALVPYGSTCGFPLAGHGDGRKGTPAHPWRIYRDAEQPAPKLPPCGRRECRVSTGIGDEVTAGIGGPDRNGYFEEPCRICEDYFTGVFFTAAPTTAAEPATGDLTLPETVTEGSGAVDTPPTDAGVEREQAARPRTEIFGAFELKGVPVPDHGTPPRFTIRTKTYRGVSGFLVYESPHKCDRPMCFMRYQRRFFCETRAEAERMRDEMKRGLAPMYDAEITRAIGKGYEQILRNAGYVW